MGDYNDSDPIYLDFPIQTKEVANIDSRSVTNNSNGNRLSQADYEQVYSFSSSGEESETEGATCSTPICIEVPQCVLVSPKSAYEPFQPPYPSMSERDAVELLLPMRGKDDDFHELHLNDFAVYCDTNIYRQEMRSLNRLETELNSPPLYFSGVLSNGDLNVYVYRIRIAALPIRNYGQESMNRTKDRIWLQSEYNSNNGVYYKLGEPAIEYKRFFEPFLWVADLAKHVADYLSAMQASRQQVTIHHFRDDFADWLLSVYSSSRNIDELRIWMGKYPRRDYRSAVNSNVGFLYKECVGSLKNKRAHYHHLWAEIFHYTNYTPYSPSTKNSSTVVTDYIYSCFSHLPFGSKLKQVNFSAASSRLRSNLIAQRPLVRSPFISSRYETPLNTYIGPGDTISTKRDTAESGTVWTKEDAKDDEHVDKWFALVQSASLDCDGQRVFEVIWYYRPVDTLCALMRYP